MALDAAQTPQGGPQEAPNHQYRPEMHELPEQAVTAPQRGNRKTNGSGVQAEDARICVVMVGLPARGKSLIASKGTVTYLEQS